MWSGTKSEQAGMNPLLFALCQGKQNKETQQTCTQEPPDNKSSKEVEVPHICCA